MVPSRAKASKEKLTLSIDRHILEEAKEAISNRKPKAGLSNMVETYLTFLADPLAWCFSCSEEFTASHTKACPRCNFLICPSCSACGCKLDEETTVAVRNMRRIYKYLGAKVDE